jgi:hypothetical protein
MDAWTGKQRMVRTRRSEVNGNPSTSPLRLLAPTCCCARSRRRAATGFLTIFRKVGCANIPRRAPVPEPAQATTSAHDAGLYELEQRWHLSGPHRNYMGTPQDRQQWQSFVDNIEQKNHNS